MQQDHPCVIRLIKQKYLRPPSPKNLPYRLGDPQTVDPSDGQAQGILRILRNQVNNYNNSLMVVLLNYNVLWLLYRPTDFLSSVAPTTAKLCPIRYTWSDPFNGVDCSSKRIKYLTVNSWTAIVGPTLHPFVSALNLILWK